MIVNLPTLPDGVYTVHWQVVLEDGDTTDGEFTFTVGKTVPVAGQTPASEGTPASDGVNWPLGWIVASPGLLLVIVIGLALYLRLNRRS